MGRRLNLRQIEAFKAVIEHGTVSRAADVLNVSQPAISKLIAHLEADAEVRLFDRVKGRLAPTERGMRLYQEIDRIFSGVQQIENAAEAIRREEQGRLVVGVMPALSGRFVQEVTMGFLRRRPNVFCSIESRSSQWIADQLVMRKLDVGLVSSVIDNPYIAGESLMRCPLMCIMPLGHPLAAKDVIGPADLNDVPFVAFGPEGFTGHRVGAMFTTYKVRANIVLVATVAPTVGEFVAAGLGVSLVHPLMVSGLRERLVARRFAPEIAFDFQLCHSRDTRNARLVEDFLQEARIAAERISREAW
ncbi:MAG TPA: LysR family transcriptional regulator [Xanthobacteraceae bacterium]|nr:LysR family transcriptional regulator [Xanthobacteraceae bacterium]